MRRTPTSDQPTTVDPVDGATVVIEAATAEAAIAEVHERLGGDARILEARRSLRGGLGGFFAREVVELHAAPGGGTTGEAPRPSTPVGGRHDTSGREAPPATGSPVDRLLAVDDRTSELDFATFLRQQLASPDGEVARSLTEGGGMTAADTAPGWLASALAEPAGGGVVEPVPPTVEAPRRLDASTLVREHEAARAAVAAPTATLDPTTAETVTAATAAPIATLDPAPTATLDPAPLASPAPAPSPSPAIETGPAWSAAALIGLGLPAELVRGLEVAAPGDDVAWTAALAASIRPLCRPLPSGNAVLVGPKARGLAAKLGLPVVATSQAVRSRARTVAAAVAGPASRAWLTRASRTRWVHLVVGGRGWRDLLQHDPLAVSWAEDDDLPEALRLASELGLVLGGGPMPGGARRGRPLDVALAIRDLLPEHGGGA